MLLIFNERSFYNMIYDDYYDSYNAFSFCFSSVWSSYYYDGLMENYYVVDDLYDRSMYLNRIVSHIKSTMNITPHMKHVYTNISLIASIFCS